MNLTPEQLEQCRKEFEEWADRQLYNLDRTSVFSDPVYYHEGTENAWIGFQSAWRPIPSMGDIENILSEYYDMEARANPFAAQAIHRAFGGKE